MLLHLFYALPLLTVLIYGLRTPGCSWMLDWTILFAGAMAQVTLVIVCLLLFIFCAKANCTSLMFTCGCSPDPVVSHRCISALPHSLHIPSPGRQMVGCYHPQCVACCCAGSAGPPLPHQPCLLHEICSQGTDQQWEEEKLNCTTAGDCWGLLHTVTSLMFSVESLLRTNCFKLTIFQAHRP